MRPVAILFANFKGNVGDFAIFDAMLRQVAARHPGQPIWVYPHGFLPIDQARMAAFESPVDLELRAGLPSHRISKGQSWLAGTPVWPGMQARAVADVAHRVGVELPELPDCEAIYTAGGDQWSGFRLGATMFGAIEGLPSGVPLRSFPFSVHQRFARHHRPEDLRRYFGRFENPLLVRDSVSLATLAALGISSDLVPDCVYSLRSAAAAVPAAPANPDRILFAITDRQSRQPKMLQTLMQQTQDMAIEHLTTCWSEDSAHLRRAGLKFHEPLTWQQTVAEFKTARLVVTNRLHGLILGTLAGAAVVPVCNRGKAASFARDAGLTTTFADAEAISQDALTKAMESRGEILAQLQAYLASLLSDGVEIGR